MSFLIGGVTYQTVKIGNGRRLHLVSVVTGRAATYCGLRTYSATTVEHSGEDEQLCNPCDAYARAAREGRTL